MGTWNSAWAWGRALCWDGGLSLTLLQSFKLVQWESLSGAVDFVTWGFQGCSQHDEYFCWCAGFVTVCNDSINAMTLYCW